MKFENAFEAFAAFLETLSVAMTAVNSINPVVNFFRCSAHFLKMCSKKFGVFCWIHFFYKHNQ
jgi:hypothetical protein